MAKTPTLTRGALMQELGAPSRYALDNMLRADEFVAKLRGYQGTRTYREMRENDPTVGGALMAFELLIRAAKLRIDPVDDSPEAAEAVEFVESLFEDMEHTLDDFLAEAVTFLAFGFSLFEKVLKVRRPGNSRFADGRIGYRKLAPRAQWTVERFVLDESGNILAVEQQVSRPALGMGGTVRLPIEKCVHFRTASSNNDPSGRSVLRNAYLSYYYASHIDMIEAIGVERELNGVPLGRIPAEYLSSDATDDQKAFRATFEQILRDVKFNDQGFVLIPSDLYEDAEGRPISGAPLVSFELVSSSGTRAIPTGEVVNRHRRNIAQSILADFLTLGQGDRGSFALSKSKTDLFLTAAMGVAGNMAATITRQIIEPIWVVNGLDPATMPKAAFDDIAPADLAELGAFIRDASAAGMPLFPDLDLENTIRGQAGFPERKEDDPDLLGSSTDPDLQEEADDAEDDRQDDSGAQGADRGAGGPGDGAGDRPPAGD